MSRIAIVDYGMGNLHSMLKAVERVGAGAHVFLCTQPEQLRRADRVIFPGVGAIKPCMQELARLGLDEALREAARERPILGVCLGMQALAEHSEENGGTPGLGLVPAAVKRLPREVEGQRLKVPHMGWNRVHQLREHPLWEDIAQDSMFYFVHSYYFAPRDPDIALATTLYGAPFTSVFTYGNLAAVQFHPEKSQTVGLKLLANFLSWDGEDPQGGA